MNAEQIQKLNMLHADLDTAVTEFVKFMKKQSDRGRRFEPR